MHRLPKTLTGPESKGFVKCPRGDLNHLTPPINTGLQAADPVFRLVQGVPRGTSRAGSAIGWDVSHPTWRADARHHRFARRLREGGIGGEGDGEVGVECGGDAIASASRTDRRFRLCCRAHRAAAACSYVRLRATRQDCAVNALRSTVARHCRAHQPARLAVPRTAVSTLEEAGPTWRERAAIADYACNEVRAAGSLCALSAA
jgi:hypothetical protein